MLTTGSFCGRLLLAAACLAALAAAPHASASTFADRFAVSGGGGRACVTGLVALDILRQDEVKVPAGQTQGLSGGAWAVLVAEVLPPFEALSRYARHVADGKGQIGASYNSFWDGAGIPYNRLGSWDNYIRTVIDDPLRNAFDHDRKSQFRFGSRARVLVGAASSTPRAVTSQMLPRLKRKDGIVTDLHCQIVATGTRSDLFCSRERRRQMGGHINAVTQKRLEPWYFTRRNQAIATSIAWIGGTLGPHRIPANWRHNGFAVQLPVGTKTVWAQVRNELNGKIDMQRFESDHYQLYDAGITCNIALTRDEMLTKGVTLSIDASADDHIHQSLEDCRRFWAAHQDTFDHERAERERKFNGVKWSDRRFQDLYGFGIKTREYEGGALEWMGRTLDLSKLRADLKPYVRVLEFMYPGTNIPTGRKLVNVAFSRYEPGQHTPVVEKGRFDKIGTTSWVFWTVPYGRPGFLNMNEGGRAFFGDVFHQMGLTSTAESVVPSAEYTGKKSLAEKGIDLYKKLAGMFGRGDASKPDAKVDRKGSGGKNQGGFQYGHGPQP